MFERILQIKENDGWVKYMLKSIAVRIYEHNISQAGGQLAFFLMLSTFPFLIFFNTLIASFNISRKMIDAFLTPVFPEEIVNLISSYVEYISNNRSIGLLSIGIVATVFSASKAVRALSRALNAAHSAEDRRTFFGEILFSMFLILAVGVMLAVMMGIVAFSTNLVEVLAREMSISPFFVDMVDVWRWITFAAFMFVFLSLMYKFVPRVKLKLRDVMPGTVFSMVGFLALTVGFSAYVEYFMRASALYGTIGTIIVLMFWLYIVSMIIILGAEINGAIRAMPARLKGKK